MRIFDSLKNRAWSGKALSVANGSINLFKNTSISQNIKIEKGNYILRATARRRVGSKGFLIELIEESGKVLKTIEIDSPNNSLSEVASEFSVPDGSVIKRIRLYRPAGSVGSFEVAKIIIDDLDHVNTANLSIRHSKIPSGYQKSHLEPTKLSFDKRDVSNSSLNYNKNTLKVAFIIDGDVSAGEMKFFRNISSELSRDTSVSLLYLGVSSKEEFRTHSLKELGSIDDLRLELSKSHYSHIIYYHNNPITDLLISLTESGRIKSNIINVKPYDRIADPNPKIKYSFEISSGIFGSYPHAGSYVNLGIDIDLFSPNNDLQFKEELGIPKSRKVLCLVLDNKNIDQSINYFNELANLELDYSFVVVSDQDVDFSRFSWGTAGSVTFIDKLDNKIYGIVDCLIFLGVGNLNYHFNIVEAISCGIIVFTNYTAIDNSISLFKYFDNPKETSMAIKNNLNNMEKVMNGIKYLSTNHSIKETVKQIKKKYLVHDVSENINIKKIVISGGYV